MRAISLTSILGIFLLSGCGDSATRSDPKPVDPATAPPGLKQMSVGGEAENTAVMEKAADKSKAKS